MSTKQLHVLNILFFLMLSLFLTLGRVGTSFNSFALLNPDLGVYTTFAAAQDHPDLFINDPFLSNEKNVNSYNMILVPVLKALNSVFGNYGTSCAFLLPFFLFLHLVGYYVLGVSMFKDPWAGLLVSLLLSAPTTTFYDFWGLILDVLPRFLYQSLIPFVLALAIRYGREPRWWPVLLGGVGLLNYVHPLSTPAWGAAIVLALWVSASQFSFWDKIRKLTIAGIVLILILSPFIANYVNSTILETSSAGNYEQTLAILQSRFSTMSGKSFTSPVTLFFAARVYNTLDVIWYLVWLLGVGGIVFGLIWYRGREENFHLRSIAAWMAGILLVGGFVPMLERMIFAYLEKIPPEFEISRTLRYLVPLVLLAAVYALRLISDHLQQKTSLSTTISRSVFYAATILLLVLWGISSEPARPEFRNALHQNVSCWQQGKFVCDLPAISRDFIDVLNLIQHETPVGARIFSEGQEVAIRYYALRPLVFTYKDGAPLAYTDQQQLLIWDRTAQEMEKLAFIRKFPFRHRGFVRGITELAQSTGADYLLLHESYKAEQDYPEALTLMYTNGHYSLFRLNGK